MRKGGFCKWEPTLSYIFTRNIMCNEEVSDVRLEEVK